MGSKASYLIFPAASKQSTVPDCGEHSDARNSVGEKCLRSNRHSARGDKRNDTPSFRNLALSDGRCTERKDNLLCVKVAPDSAPHCYLASVHMSNADIEEGFHVGQQGDYNSFHAADRGVRVNDVVPIIAALWFMKDLRGTSYH